MTFKAYTDNIQAKTGKTPQDFWKLAIKKGFVMRCKIVAKHAPRPSWPGNRQNVKSPIISPNLESGIPFDRSTHRPSVIYRKNGKFHLAIEARITPRSAGLAHHQCERTHQHLHLLATHNPITSIMKIGRIQHQLSHAHLLNDK